MTLMRSFVFSFAVALATIAALGGCTPTVKVATDEPITINLNVNIRHEILIKVDKQLDSVIDQNSDIF
jgi:YnbE-like lipoprotein